MERSRVFCFFLCKQKTAYEMRISDWSSDVCSSDLAGHDDRIGVVVGGGCGGEQDDGNKQAHGRFSRWFDARLANRREKSTIWLPAPETGVGRSEERSVGKEGVSTGRTRWSPIH